jgi:ABC-2 type transport system ATP-binding protein
MSIIKIREINKRFGKTIALNNLSLDVEEGEIFGFLGPNGAGKTTTIRSMLDLIRPNSGTIEIFKLDSVVDSIKIREEIGYLPADNSVYKLWTGQEHFNYLEKLRGKKSIYLNKLIIDFDFNPKVRAGTLSSGNLQKLSIIMALMFNPKLLILDEPTRGLDPILQHEFLKLMKEYNEKGTTIFISSHNLNEVENFCHKAGIIKQGQIVATEKISELKRKMMHIINVDFLDKYDLKEFEISVVDQIEKTPAGLSIKVKKDINPVLQIIAKHKVKDLTINQAGLEEIFLEFYK